MDNYEIKNKHFPTICVDGFFTDPYKIREFALNLPFYSTEDGAWPGKRTEPLHLVEKDFFDAFCNKVFSLFNIFKYEETEWNVKAQFQIVEPFSTSKESVKNKGWIHTDQNVVYAGIIYLTPDIDPNTGTSLFKQVKEIPAINHKTSKEKYYKENIDVNFDLNLKESNSSFEETITFKNIFNRLIAFEGNIPHGVNSFYTQGAPRLTLVFFVYKYKSQTTPILRSSEFL